MIFSELYSAYYKTVARILTRAMEPSADWAEFDRIVREEAFGESALTILTNLRSGKWPLLRADGGSVLSHAPELPLTLLEKRWLRSLADDPRLRLFGVELPDLEGVEPLFTPADFRIYDRCEDGDPYEDPVYIENFRCLLRAIREQSFVEVKLDSHRGPELTCRFYPRTLEYSEKDDKFRVFDLNGRNSCFRLSSLKSCRLCPPPEESRPMPQEPGYMTVTLEVTDRRKAMERAMVHFSHFQKEAVRLDGLHYRLRVRCRREDEKELLIRVLAFGPLLRVMGPESFLERIKTRLRNQKSCGL